MYLVFHIPYGQGTDADGFIGCEVQYLVLVIHAYPLDTRRRHSIDIGRDQQFGCLCQMFFREHLDTGLGCTDYDLCVFQQLEYCHF